MYSFTASGHKNIRATHRNTLELTKDAVLTEDGDCIIGVKAEFELEKIKQFLQKEKIKITIRANGITETVTAVPNPNFSDEHEMVIRITNFDSKRTFATRADKSAKQLSRRFVKELKNDKTRMVITIEEGK